MLIDAQIRSRVLQLADAVEEHGVDVALRSVRAGAEARRRRDIATRVVAGTAVCLAVVGVVGWNSSGVRDLEQPQPADRVDRMEDRVRVPLPEQRSDAESRSDRQNGAGAGKAQFGDEKSSGGAGGQTKGGDSRSPAVVPAPVAAAQTEDPIQNQPVGYEFSRREGALYEAPAVSFKPDQRSGCSVDGTLYGPGCVSFPIRSDDRALSVGVKDRSGPVFVRVTQWNRHGATVGDPMTFCGGDGAQLELQPDVTRLLVSVEEGDCAGRRKTPAGGEVNVSFYR